MAWTQQDLDQVQAAVLALSTGARVTKVSYAGPPARETEYGFADLAQLRALLASIQRAVNGTPAFRHATFNKGFDRPGGGSDGDSSF
jgi:hypothetical protein